MTKEDPPWLGPTQKKHFEITPSRKAKSISKTNFTKILSVQGRSFSEEHRLLFLGEIRKEKIKA